MNERNQEHPSRKKPQPEYEYEDEIELMDYINVIWKKKWLILIPTFILVVLAAVYSLLQTPVWKVESILQPSKFFTQNEQGEYKEIIVTPPKQIASQINRDTYNHLLAAELNIDIRGFPKIEAETVQDTNLVAIATKVAEVEKGKEILLSLFKHLKRDLDKKVDVEMKNVDTQIKGKNNLIDNVNTQIENLNNKIELQKITIEDKQNAIKTKKNRIKDKENLIKTKQNAIKSKNLNIESKEIEKNVIKENIKSLQNKLEISKERAQALTEEMKEVKQRIQKIEEEQRKVLQKGTNKNALSILLYSNEIQNNFRYYNTLDEKLSNERVTQENITFSIDEKKESLKQIDNQIEQINTEIDNIRTEIDNIRTQIDDIHTQIDNIKNEIGKVENSIESIRNDITTKRNQIENIRNEIAFLKDKKARIDYAQLIKEPTSSLGPVAPKKKRNVVIAGVLGLFIFTLLAFFIEYIQKQKSQEESR